MTACGWNLKFYSSLEWKNIVTQGESILILWYSNGGCPEVDGESEWTKFTQKKVLELVELSYPASLINTPIFIFLIFSQF